MNHFFNFIFILVFVAEIRPENHAFVDTDAPTLNDGSVVTVILSQANKFHSRKAEKFKIHLEEQIRGNTKWGSVYALHDTWPELGAWTIFPLFKKLLKRFPTSSWVLFCDENTRVNATIAERILSTYDPYKDPFLGKAIQDREASIVHHFAFHENPEIFSYPDYAAGFALSFHLMRELELRIKHHVDNQDFSIDPLHELALFIWNEGSGPALTNVPEFCIERSNASCATHFIGTQIQECEQLVKSSDVFFAVKTCTKYHDSRVQVILNTWGEDTQKNLKFFSDSSGDVPLAIINLGLPNTEKGHCAKTMGILHYVIDDKLLSNNSWLVIADDDTLISVPRLLKLLSCYNAQEVTILGERYGFRTAAQKGYDYVTGGGGMVLSMLAVKSIVNSDQCECPSADAPDDMFIGNCLKFLHIPITHVNNFHQARPCDYNFDMLQHQEPISFHKFWLIDPLETYKTWLSEAGTSSSLDASHKQRFEL